jgi:hypothetical protein
VYEAIQGAKRFILITGWSVWTETALKRQPASPERAPPLGQLLLAKAAQGVKVRAGQPSSAALPLCRRSCEIDKQLAGLNTPPSSPDTRKNRVTRCCCWSGTTPPTTWGWGTA